MLKRYAIRARGELEDLLLSKETWLALLGVVVAVAKWQGWDMSTEVFAAIEIFLLAVLLVLNKK